MIAINLKIPKQTTAVVEKIKRNEELSKKEKEHILGFALVAYDLDKYDCGNGIKAYQIASDIIYPMLQEGIFRTKYSRRLAKRLRKNSKEITKTLIRMKHFGFVDNERTSAGRYILTKDGIAFSQYCKDRRWLVDSMKISYVDPRKI